MRPSDDHYDGNDPRAPIPADHFPPNERRESAQLGDGSPAVAPRVPTAASESSGRDAEGSSEVQRSAAVRKDQ